MPDFSKFPDDAKILILNYPHNPTGSFAPKRVFEEAVKWAKEHKTLIIHDMDNSEVTHSGRKPVGIMQVDGAKDVAFQIHTMSKAQSMPGLRVAFTVSDKENIDNLLNAKYLSGGSVYVPVQHATIAALKDEEGYINKINKIYRERKNTAIIARMVSFCLETGNKTLKFATNKPENIKLYKSLGMVKDGTRNFNGENYTVLKFDEASMRAYLNKYQINLTC